MQGKRKGKKKGGGGGNRELLPKGTLRAHFGERPYKYVYGSFFIIYIFMFILFNYFRTLDARGGHTSCVLNGKFFVWGGNSQKAYFNELHYVDPNGMYSKYGRE
jgi:hypothetical protein